MTYSFNRYEIDYEHGTARFYTPTGNNFDAVLQEFSQLASQCFGLRKSLGQLRIVTYESDVLFPEELRGKGGTQAIVHNGDSILFDETRKSEDGRTFKIKDEFDNWFLEEAPNAALN